MNNTYSRRSGTIDHQRRPALHHQPGAVPPEPQRPPLDLRALPPLYLGELDLADVHPAQHALVHDQHTALADRVHRQLRRNGTPSLHTTITSSGASSTRAASAAPGTPPCGSRAPPHPRSAGGAAARPVAALRPP